MDIIESKLHLAAQRTAFRAESTQTQLSLRTPAIPNGDRVELSSQAQAAAEADAREAELRADPQLGALIRLIETLTGRAVRVFDAMELSPEEDAELGAATPARRETVDFDLRQRRQTIEYESTRFQARGSVHTADGQRIEFELSLRMERYYQETSELRVQSAAQRKDPLVINFAGSAAELSSQRFRFDLDADGAPDSLPRLGAGSGFLVLDRNGNGRVDDGRELFGARSGEGFAELAVLDSDGDGWIDAADPAFARLQVWRGGQLRDLAEFGVAALSTRSIATAFDLRGVNNADLGQIRSTGLYLGEDARVGTLQQVDLSV